MGGGEYKRYGEERVFEGIQSMAKTSVTKSGKWGGGSEREKLDIKEEI